MVKVARRLPNDFGVWEAQGSRDILEVIAWRDIPYPDKNHLLRVYNDEKDNILEDLKTR